jgi:hypothetical protein
MKEIIIFFVLIITALSTYSQSFDTIQYDDGSKMIIDSQDYKRIQDNMKKRGSAVFEGNYKVFDKENNVIKEMFLIEYEEGHYQKMIWKNGTKVWEEYGKFDEGYIHTLIWNDKRIIQFQQHVVNGIQIRIDYYDEYPCNISTLKKFKKKQGGLGLKFVDPVTSNYWVEISDERLIWVPFDTQIEYYSNGKIKKKGRYLEARFEIYKTEEEYIKCTLNPEIELISDSGFAKEGEWIYYYENGEIEYIEQFKNGLKIE